MLRFTNGKAQEVCKEKERKVIALLSSLIIFINSSTIASEHLLICDNLNSNKYLKIALTDQGQYFTLETLSKDGHWEQLTFFSDLVIPSYGVLRFKDQQQWPCNSGTCYRKEFFSFDKDTLKYSKYLKSDTFNERIDLSSTTCLFDFPNT